ncbi:MAG: twitching motility protein PilT [Lachnospiraceae bacterium]|nr:twitching motility protein PilT [Lachnospiraceae bacterium]
MIQIIAGQKGKGKTKRLIDKANDDIKRAKGNIVYLDKSDKHMYELSNKIRLINVLNYGVDSTDGFLGFISGIISQDHDLDTMFLDSFLKLANLEGKDISDTIDKLDKIGSKFNVTFVLSVSLDGETLPENVKPKILISL